jgi:ferric-dicitrate binding protein FerR (iron transport regulator)
MQKYDNIKEADRLVALLHSGRTLTEEERQELFRWMDVEGNDQLLRDALDRYHELHPEPEHRIVPDPAYVETAWRELAARLGLRSARVVPLRRPGWRRVALRVAAVLLPAAMVVGGYFGWLRSADRSDEWKRDAAAFVPSVKVEPHADSVRHIILPDGTEVTLNRGATFAYNDHREGELKGEAYFKVAKDPEHPFVIHSEHVKIRVLGTEFHFNTHCEEGMSRLALYNGAVELDHAQGMHRLDAAGKEFRLDHATQVAAIEDFDCTALPEWIDTIDDVFNFLKAGDLFDQIEQVYGVTITGREWIDENKELNFVLDQKDSIGDVMSMLEFLHGGFSHQIEGENVTLHRRE